MSRDIKDFDSASDESEPGIDTSDTLGIAFSNDEDTAGESDDTSHQTEDDDLVFEYLKRFPEKKKTYSSDSTPKEALKNAKVPDIFGNEVAKEALKWAAGKAGVKTVKRPSSRHFKYLDHRAGTGRFFGEAAALIINDKDSDKFGIFRDKLISAIEPSDSDVENSKVNDEDSDSESPDNLEVLQKIDTKGVQHIGNYLSTGSSDDEVFESETNYFDSLANELLSQFAGQEVVNALKLGKAQDRAFVLNNGYPSLGITENILGRKALAWLAAKLKIRTVENPGDAWVARDRFATRGDVAGTPSSLDIHPDDLAEYEKTKVELLAAIERTDIDAVITHVSINK